MADALLEVAGLKVSYGDIAVLHSVSLVVRAGEAVCVIGSNGAGKSTLLNAISGVLPASEGTISVAGRNLTRGTCRARVEAGVVQVPEGRRLFAGMSVRQNLLMGGYLRSDGRAAKKRDLDFIFETFPRLAEKSKQDASTMSGGEQQMCAIGRGIMAKPKLLMVDELSLGLSPKVVDEIGGALRTISTSGVSLLIIEQDVFTALELTQYGVVLNEGRIEISGSSAELLANPRVRQAYLGIEPPAIQQQGETWP